MDNEAPGFRLCGTRVTNDYVWVNLEGTPEMRGASPPFGLAICSSDEVDGKVTVAWFTKGTAWTGKNLSVSNSGFNRYWSKKVDDKGELVKPVEWIAVTDIISVSTIVPVRVALVSESYEKVRVQPDAVRAVLQYYDKKKKTVSQKRKR